MSLYNLINGVNQATFYILPMLGNKHPSEYPRFRDCFIVEGDIVLLTRVGGDNRNSGYGEEELYNHPNFIETKDDKDDNTYATYRFSVPDEWKSDFNHIMGGNFKNVSKLYQQRLYDVFPSLKEKFDEMFG